MPDLNRARDPINPERSLKGSGPLCKMGRYPLIHCHWGRYQPQHPRKQDRLSSTGWAGLVQAGMRGAGDGPTPKARGAPG